MVAALSVAVLLTACGGGGGGSDAGTTGGGSTGGGSSGGGGGTQSYTVGGTVSGLSGAGLVLQINAGGDLAVSSSGTFTFATSLASGASYSVSIKTQPSSPTQTCVLGNASGTIGSSNVTNVSVACTTTAAYTIGGTVSGLSADAGLVLQQGSEQLALSHNGSFVFATSVLSGALYNVTVSTQPTAPVQNCVVTNATGTIGSAAVVNVAVTCDGIALLAGALGGPGTADGVGATARFDGPYDVAADSAGNVYVADTNNSTIRKITPAGVVSTLAGTPGLFGFADGTGSAAQFAFPRGLAADTAGNVYVADLLNNRIRKITPAGVVSTFAGVAAGGSTDGSVSVARFRSPNDIAVDPSGVVYVADTSNHTIRKITPDGLVTTLAGTAGTSGSADGSGSAARFNAPAGIAIDAAGNVYVADTGNYTIRKVTSAGVVSTLAGTAGTSGSDDGNGSAARFSDPRGLAVDTTGNIYVADISNTIRRITPAGDVSTLAGSAGQSGSADGSGSAARFFVPSGVAIDATGNVYVADRLNNTIRKIAQAGVVSTLAGKAKQYVTADVTTDGSGAAARFAGARGVATDTAGNVYVADGNTIRKSTPAGVVSTLAGGSEGADDGTGTAAKFSGAFGVAIDSANNVYVADSGNSTIRKITPAGVVSTLAGTAGQLGSDDGVGSAARFESPYDVATDAADNVYVVDQENNTIRKITPAGVVSTLAGAAGQSGSADGTGSAATFYVPSGLATDAAGNVYVADSFNNTIRKITPAGVVSTLAGTAGQLGTADGNGSAARFTSPSDVTVDAAGNVFVADYGNSTIRRITPDGTVTTVAGTPGVTGVRLGPLPGSLNRPRNLARLPGSRITLVETDVEQGLLLITLP